MPGSNFVDYVKLFLASGAGGSGSTHLRREKYIPKGGPDGGDGGRGGHIILRGNPQYWTLIHLKYRKHIKAKPGESGSGNLCKGANGEDIILEVPLGTVARNAETGEVLFEITQPGEEKIIVKGGRGGLGNANFKSATNQTPRYAQPGEEGVEGWFILELKILADVGLVGFPNAGKSTLLSTISAARPKIADYAFTTLEPSVGVVRYYDDKSFIVADIPGIIEGAAEGRGLGHRFLRHIERTRMLVHVVDVSGMEGRDPYEDFKKINKELKEYSEKLASLPQIVALNKCDVYGAEENVKEFKKKCRKYKKYPITAVTGEGTRELIEGIFEVLDTLPPAEPIPADEFEYERPDINEFEVYKDEEENVWYVTGGLVDMLERNVVLSDPDSMAYFQKVLKDKGVIKELKRRGVAENDVVVVGGVEFEFRE